MSYHLDPVINDIVLTIVNDGEGEQCGMNYAARIAAADYGIFEYRLACRRYGRHRHRVYGASIPTRDQIIIAADLVQNYYRAHVRGDL